MSDDRLRVSLFDLAVDISTTTPTRVRTANWITDGPRTPRIDISLHEQAVANVFLAPQSVAAVLEQWPEVEAAIERLRALGVLLTPAQWDSVRAQHPYDNRESLWLNRPEHTVKHASYEDAYRAGAAPWNDLPQAVEVAALLPLPARHMRVLDVGCGSGHNVPLLQRLDVDVAGIDISATAIAQAKLLARHPDHFVAGSVTALPWPDASFDAVVDIGCLHCLAAAEVAAYVGEVRRVLAPEGRFVCRAFKPREADVVALQPVDMVRLGYTPDEVQTLFAGALEVSLVKEGPVHGIYLGVR